MHAVVRRYEGIDRSSVDEIKRRGNDELVPLIREAPGFIAHFVLWAEDGTMISTSVFEDRNAAEESNRQVVERIGNSLASLFPRPQVTSGDVLLHTLGTSGAR
jgi:hypothetical protein